MCGIAGSIGAVPPSPERVEAALRSLDRRGPDAYGSFTYQQSDQHYCLIHSRLAIIDLDPRSNQPMHLDNLTIIFNGELYNYIELRRELQTLGHTFHTDSDTEVVLAAYREWDDACWDRFEGMWALAILNRDTGEVTLSRDRFGEKPLFTWVLNGCLYFASEIKTLAALAGQWPQINEQQIKRYLVNGYKFLHKKTDTFYKGIFELPAATLAIITSPSQLDPKKYWSLPVARQEMTFDEAVEEAKARLFRSVELRMRADVPLAFCLSGGVDSTTLAAIASKKLGRDIHCFSIIDSDERYNESDNINLMVRDLGCDHHTVQTSTHGFFERMENLVAYHDAPVATISYYLHSFLSQSIAEKGYKVAISGTAADEIFTGYYDHYPMWLAAMHQENNGDIDLLVADWKSGMGKHIRNPQMQDPLAFVQNPDKRDHIILDQSLFNSFLVEPHHEPWHESTYHPELLRNRMANELFHEAVPVLLKEDDRNSMNYSVENRSPFLDRDLVEFLYSVPTRHLIGNGFAKRILREIGRGIVPEEIRLDDAKKGFNASINSLVDRNDQKTRERLLENSPVFDIVKKEALAGFLKDDLTSNSFSKFLFSFISAKLFLEQPRETSR